VSLPSPEAQPLLRIADLVGVIPGLGRSALYAALQRGDLPCVRIGARAFVVNAELQRQWGLRPDEGPVAAG